jgi:hypothetical protein
MTDMHRQRRGTSSIWQVFQQDFHAGLSKINDSVESMINWVFAFSQAGAQRRWNALLALSALVWFGLAFWLHPINLGVDPLTSQLLSALFAANVIRRMIVLWLALFIGARLAAVFLDDVFELKDVSVAARFLQTAAFSGWYNILTIRDGDVARTDQNSPIFRIGGPGKVDVHLENAALFEKIDGKPHVLGPTSQRYEVLEGFERLRSVIDLRDQFFDLTVEGRSKDGIPVIAKDVRLVSSVYRGRQNVRSPDHFRQPYPFKDEAIQSLVYKHDRRPLPKAIKGSVISELGSFIGKHTLSEFLTNADASIDFIPRDKITNLFYDYAKEFSQKAETRGIELKWIGVGTWVVPGEVISGRQLEAWKLTCTAVFNQNPDVLERLRQERRQAVIINLVDGVPNLFFTLIGQGFSPEDVILHLLKHYREKYLSARDLYRESGLIMPPELNIVIHHLNRLTAHWLGGES